MTDHPATAKDASVPSHDPSPGAVHAAPVPEMGREMRDFAIRIDRDGTWYYHGSPIQRQPMVKLFASVLRRGDDGTYWLVTPAEYGQIEVEDVPFTAIELTVTGNGKDQILAFRTNVDDVVEAGESHPLHVTYDATNKQPSPYLLVRDKLEAKIIRPVFYQLVDLGIAAEDDPSQLGVWSNGQFFPLGSLTTED